MISHHYLHTFCIIIVLSTISAASQGKVAVFLDISNNADIKLVREVFPLLTERGETYEVLVIVSPKNATTARNDLLRHLNTPKFSSFFPNQKFEWLVNQQEVLEWLSMNAPETVLCFSQDIWLPFAVVDARRKGIIPINSSIISIMEDRRDSTHIDTLDEVLHEKMASTVEYSDHVLFANVRAKNFLRNIFLGSKHGTANKHLLEKVNSALILGTSSWGKQILLLIPSKHISGVKRESRRYKRNVAPLNVASSSLITSSSSSVAVMSMSSSQYNEDLSSTTYSLMSSSPQPSASPSVGVSPSMSSSPRPSSSPSVGVSPSMSSSTRPSISPSVAVSPSMYSSPRPSSSPSVGVSPSMSSSTRPSISPSVGVSPSMSSSPRPSSSSSVGVSPSMSSSPRPSSSSSVGVSPSMSSSPGTSASTSVAVSPPSMSVSPRPSTSSSVAVSPSISSSPQLQSSSSYFATPSISAKLSTSSVNSWALSTLVTKHSVTSSSTYFYPDTTPSTTQKPTTAPRQEKKRYLITFKGDCEKIVSNPVQKEEFMKQFKETIATIISISVEDIHVDNIRCGSILVTFTVAHASSRTIDELEKALNDKRLKVQLKETTYVASKVEVVKPSPTSGSSSSSDKKLAFWLYVSFGAAMGLIFLIGLVVLLVRCRRDRLSKTFVLSGDADMELKRYRGMPRSSYYRVEMYGDPMEADAVRSGIDEEYDGEALTYRQSNISLSSSKQESRHPTNNVSSQDEFYMGNLPEWKVPKLKTSEVVVNDSNEDRKSDDDGDDVLHAYDNPVMTFGGSSSDASVEK